MKNLITYISFLSIFFLACSQKEQLPSDVLSKEDLVDVLVEIEKTQAVIKLKFNTTDSIINQKEIFDETFKKMKITQQQFNSSLKYYCNTPKTLEGVYEKVIVKLSEKQAENQ